MFRTLSALVLAILVSTAALADGIADVVPMYNSVEIKRLLSDPKVKTHLKISAAQEAPLKACLKKWDDQEWLDMKAKLDVKGNTALRAFNSKRAGERFQDLTQILSGDQIARLKQIMLQGWGMILFNHPEARLSLRLSPDKAKLLQDTYDDVQREVDKAFVEKRISQQEALRQKNLNATVFPERVLSVLNDEQRKNLKEMVGEPFPLR